MTNKVKKEVEKLIKEEELNCSVEEFEDKIDWKYISIYQILSEDFIKEFKDKVNWYCISCYQTLSEEFIYNMRNYINIDYCLRNNLITQEYIDKRKIVNRYDLMDLE